MTSRGSGGPSEGGRPGGPGQPGRPAAAPPPLPEAGRSAPAPVPGGPPRTVPSQPPILPAQGATRPPLAPGPPAASEQLPVNPEVVRILQASPLFKSFTETGLAIVASIAQEKSIPAGAPLFVEHMIGDGLFVVAEGQIRLSVRGPRGEETRLAVVGPHESLGEAALLRAGPRQCSAVADTAVRVLEITRRDLAALQRTKPQACLKLMMGVVELIGERLAEAEPELRQFLAWKLGA